MPFVTDHPHWPDAAVVQGRLSAEDCARLTSLDIWHLVLNTTLGWDGHFAEGEQLPGVEALDVVAGVPFDVDAVHDLGALRRLHLGGTWRGRLAMARLPQLRALSANLDHKKASIDGFADAGRLVSASGNLSQPQLEDVAQCPTLERLEVMLTRIDLLDWLRGQHRLKALRLNRTSPLADLGGLRHADQLQALQLRECKKVASLAVLSAVPRLAMFLFDEGGKVDSLHPLRGCPEIEYVSLGGETSVVDGQLSALEQLPRLKGARFLSRGHYDRQPAAFPFDQRAFEQAFFGWFGAPRQRV